MTTCLVVEDEPLARRKLCELLRETPWIGVVLEADRLATARVLIREHDVTLTFLDIRLPDGRSLSLLDDLPDGTIVVFTTAFDEYAVTAFELQALDYLVKPFSAKRFRTTLDRVHQALPASRDQQRARALTADANAPPRTIFARTGNDAVSLDLEHVDRIEGHDDHAAFWLGGRRHLVYRRLKELEHILAPAGFVRVHRSFLINVHHVDRLSSLRDGRISVLLTSGARVTTSKARAAELRRRIEL